ncbi:MAG: tetratricopeptide repeat protein [Thiohalocapsa sp.]|nr:tetratricopeptide repeat protein [Thiohalocapsa sp.]
MRRASLRIAGVCACVARSRSWPSASAATAPVIALLCLLAGPAAGGLAAAPPQAFAHDLVPVAESDVSGAEALVQQAIAEARAEINALLAQPLSDAGALPDAGALADAYGRLGALFLLVEVEAQADACLRNAMTLAPEAFRWPYYAGYLAMLAGNLDRAVDYLQRARAIDPDYPTLYVRLGKVHLDNSELAEAKAAFERVDDVPELASPVNYYLGQIALLERRHEDALALLQAALAANPQATEVHYPLAQAYRALGDTDKARLHLDRFELRAPEVADPLLEELQAATKRALPAFKRGIHAVQQGDYAAAVDEFAAGLAVDPNNAAARVSYARVLYLVGRRDDAAAELDRALALDPRHLLGHFLAGVLHQARGDTEAAARAYRHVLALDSKHTGARFYLANLDFAAGRFAQAADAYRRVLADDASIAPARLLAVIADGHAGAAPAELAVSLSGLADAHPDDLQVQYALTRLLAAADDPAVRDPERASELARSLIARMPIPPHQRLLALAQAGAGDFEQAVDTQQGLVALAGWMAPPAEMEAMRAELDAYRRGELPSPAWLPTDALLSPPRFDPMRPFRDYPATTPY